MAYKKIEKLANSVIAKYQPTGLATVKFLPHDQLEVLVTMRVVEAALRDANVPDVKDLVDFVLGGAQRIFLILVLMTTKQREKLSLLKQLQQQNIKDDALPIGFRRDEKKQGIGERDNGQEAGSKPEKRDEENDESESDSEDELGPLYGFSLEGIPDGSQFTVFDNWERTDCDLFESYQWILLAPVFGNGKFHFTFHSKRILPFLEVASKPTAEGFFGEVSRIEIHPGHVPKSFAKSNTGGVAIAVKKAKNITELAKYFDKEADNLQKIQEYKSPHLIKPIAAYKINQDRCLVFPWANGGNLGNYWETYGDTALKMSSLKWIISQFVGVCSALEELHVSNVRHGDLKPGNILWFMENNEQGTLQIADMGLTSFHEEEANTKNRLGIATDTPSGTARYEPPEMNRDRGSKEHPRSRAYDIWSMGCIVLELIIWIIYGSGGLKTFQEKTPYLWKKVSTKENSQEYVVHPYVVSCMRIIETQVKDHPAYREFLDLVQARLLIVPVSDVYESSPYYRETAAELRTRMEKISQDCESNTSYLTILRIKYPSDEIQHDLDSAKDTPLTDNARPTGKVYQKNGNLAAPGQTTASKSLQPSLPVNHPNLPEIGDIPVIVRAPTGEFNSETLATNTSNSTDHQGQSSKLDDIWDSIPDNDFASSLFKLVSWDQVKPEPNYDAISLCPSCKGIRSTQLFDTRCDLSMLQSKSQGCSLCKILFEALGSANIKPPRVVTLRQNGATVGVEGGPNLLSIYVEPDSYVPENAQLGFPRLLEQASTEQFALLLEWIRVCDTTHKTCARDDGEVALAMPTRLVEVGHSLRLVDSISIEPSRYTALSHCWGPLKDNEKFCTYKRNIAKLKSSIDFELLPPTFRDAVTVTRGLGIRYIWIDSLCIIQDDVKDWESEAAKMEQVFATAYCTIGASSARSSLEGFLARRPPRPCVQLQTQSVGTLYVCPDIDNFYRDVELGELNRRGWVLQERALSRRSIHYTSTQVYWECGAGVHCETLARLQNSKAAFLGDANFPKSALEYHRDGRQVLIQDLYERYSGLALTAPSDRSVAILGLQTRLARTFRTQAAYGLFAVYFARGLLWQRRDVRRLTRIAWPAGRFVPSWSWLSKEGAIKYMDLKFGTINWAMATDFKNPFVRRSAALQPETSSGLSSSDGDLMSLRGLARRMNATKLELLVRIIFDEEREFEPGELRCVVIGRDKEEAGKKDQKFYVLIIHRVSGALEENIYERVGVASLKPSHVGSEGSWVTIR